MNIQTIYNKGISSINEDAFLVADPIFGVFDGVSGLEPYKNAQGQTGAALASSIARDVFSGSSETLVETAVRANHAIAVAMKQNGIDAARKTAQWATTASVVKLGKDTFDWLKIGDSFIMTILHDGSWQLLGNNDVGDLEIMLLWKELAMKQTENIREVVKGQMVQARTGAENFGDLNGEKGIEKFLEHGSVTLKHVAHILLFTDGLRIPKEDPRQSDDLNLLIELFLAGGLQKVQDYVRAQEETDPKCWKYPRFKQHDDIAGVAITF